MATAIYCWVLPTRMLEVIGVTAMLDKTGAGAGTGTGTVTATVAVPLRAPKAALIAVLPAVKPFARPVPEPTLATVGVAAVQVERVVTLRDEPSE